MTYITEDARKQFVTDYADSFKKCGPIPLCGD